MVTDIMDSEEPIRNRLRTLGVEILSDISVMSKSLFGSLDRKLQEVVSLLNIASTMNLVSEMNCNILKKEFTSLKMSLQEQNIKPSWLEEFLSEPPLLDQGGVGGGNLNPLSTSPLLRGRGNHKGHVQLGVQKGSTLLKAIKDIPALHPSRDQFNSIKKERRSEIIECIKIKNGGATIKDIKDIAHTLPYRTDGLASCGDKTLQRELMSMTKEGVLYKQGSKRWSRYFIKA